MRRTIFALLMCAAVTFAQAGHAAIWTFEGGMNTDQSAATHALGGLTGFAGGFIVATLDDVTGAFDWTIGFAGLSGPAVAAHFHGPAFTGATAPVTLATPSLAGAVAGLFSGGAILTPVGIAELTGGGSFVPGDETPWYHNIHTASNPAGEIRGQLFVTSIVPVPPALVLLLSAVAAIAGLGRRAAD